ncbi:MAG: Rieske 2Fe-2S domain-containing protein [Phycisphaerales bacterium]|nr:Rieske 2Fe-2S domain-containing protein [Phycisphaerales bacterium]
MMRLMVLAGIVAVGGGGIGGCAWMDEKKKEMITRGVVNLGTTSDFPAGTANTKFMDTYGIVVVNASGDPAVVRPKCTHKGCVGNAKWEEDHNEFVCPADKSRFDLVGRVTKEPATRPLPAIRATRQPDGTLTVDLTKLYTQ